MPAEHHRSFARALLDPAQRVPDTVRATACAAAGERFAVYRANVAHALVDALRSNFPVVERLVGGEFFTEMARMFALRNPPSSPVLLAYGQDFPAFIAGFRAVRALPYLADVARLEWSWLEAFHAADAPVLTMIELEDIPQHQWPDLRFALHPAVRLLDLATPALSIWRHHQCDEQLPAQTAMSACDPALVTRPQSAVHVVALTCGGLSFLETVMGGGTLAAAAALAVSVEPGLDLEGLLPLLFDAGAFGALASS